MTKIITAKRITAADRRAASRARGLISETARARALGIKGRVAVELVDDASGRVVKAWESDNYVNVAQWEAFAETVQKTAWVYGYQGDSSTITNRADNGRDPRTFPTLRNDHLACWTDTTAENTADLWPFGEIVAWAHRWQQGSPSTRQGIVQPSLCLLDSDSVSWVWEWATSNGNGTFQSVGWRRIGFNTNTGDASLGDRPNFSRRYLSGWAVGILANVSDTFTITGSGGVSSVPRYYDSGSGKLYMIPYVTTPSVRPRLLSYPVTIDSAGNFTVGTQVDEGAAAFAAGVIGDNTDPNTRQAFGLTRLGASGDWIAVGRSGSGTAQRPIVRRVTNAGSLTYSNLNAGTFTTEGIFTDVTYDGTNLWASHVGTGGTNAIYRLDPATGNVSATISAISGVPAYWNALSTGLHINGIEWDADNGWLWVCTTANQIFNIDTSGNWLGVLLRNVGNEYPISSATLSGQHNAQRAPDRGFLDSDEGVLALGYGSTGGNSTSFPYAPGQTIAPSNPISPVSGTGARLVTMDGDVWLCQANTMNTANGTVALHAFTRDPCFASRTLLDSPATKTSSQTMRIRYTMTFT